MSVAITHTTAMPTLLVPTIPDPSHALATAVSVVMVPPVLISMSVERTPTTAIPTHSAPTRRDHSRARATAALLVMV